MSIKKLFDSTKQSTVYSDFKNQRDKYSSVESVRNAEELVREQQTFVPDVDYSKPENFAFYGSAYLYYKSGFDHIADYYPYDGSLAEQNKFYNKLLPSEKYILNKKYPRTTGYAILTSDGYGSSTKTNGYGLPSILEYITLKGGPHTGSHGVKLSDQAVTDHSSKPDRSNIYDETIYESAGLPSDYGKGTRESNLRANFSDGVTVEFWLKTGSLNTSLTEKQVVFDLWNNAASGSGAMNGTPNNTYGRIRLELNSATSKRFTFTVQSGSNKKTSTIGPTAYDTFSDWKHYALSLYNSGSNFIAKLYVNGSLNETVTSIGTVSELNSKNMMARIGALITNPSGSAAAAGAGKLSGSMDEFRFWKVTRNAAEVSENYFDRVGGGTNTDISNTTLGVYFKFNEGITANSTVDSTVTDYSGRLSNGAWTGYGSNSRNTGSAMVSASVAIAEYEDPIIRTNHPTYISNRKELLDKGSYYDSTNHSAFVNHAPSWVLERHEDDNNDNLKIISHIVGSYFDSLYLLSKEFPKFKQVSYISSSGSPPPFASHLPQSLGLYVPDIFVDASVQEMLLNRSPDKMYESSLQDAKNLIYQNLYNNLANIYKAKGTEKAFKNILRCFNIDDDLVKLKIYSDNSIYEINNNLKQVTSINKSVNFNTPNNGGAVVYQRKDTTNANSRGYLSASQAGNEKYYGFTTEADVIFPRYFTTRHGNINRENLQVSLFGVVSPKTGAIESQYFAGTNTTVATGSRANFQVYAMREEAKSKNIYFKLESSGSANPFPTLTSSLFKNVYDDNRWNISVRLKPTSMGLSGLVTGSTLTYDLIFRGVNSVLGTVRNSFEVSSSVSFNTGSKFLTNHKRVYAGAFRNNVTGTSIHNSDVKISNVKHWTKFVENSNLELHMLDVDNSGVSGSYKNVSSLDTLNNKIDIMNKDTLALEWNYDSITTSDAGGNFVAQDFSSGSALIRNNLGWIGKINGYQHNGYGNYFAVSSKSVIDRERTNSFKFIDPEEVVSSEMISILTDDDELLGYDQVIPNYILSAEKSMYGAISDEMLIFFAGIIDFNNLIGEPVNRYRGRYKDLEKLREAFFRRVKDVKEVEKFLDYYKWFDSAIAEIFSQLVPASANFVEGVSNVIESHVLERNKYKTPFPTLEAKQPDPEASLFGYTEKVYPYETAFSPLPSSPRKTNKKIDYWQKRAERTAIEVSSGDASLDAKREKIRTIINSNPTLTASRESIVVSTKGNLRYNLKKYAKRNFGKVYDYNVTKSPVYKGGTNFSLDKNIEFSKVALLPGGPVNREGGKFVPQNILLSFVKDFEALKDFKDPSKQPNKKVKRIVPVDYGRHHDDKDGYYHVKSSRAFPFNIVSSSVSGGYQTDVQNALGLNLEITNLHNDVYGDDMEKPIQGIFTEHNVGGNQHRHVPLNTGADNNNNRPEAWRILLGTCNVSPSGAIGMVGADYPMSPNYVAPAGANHPYPHAIYPKATRYRDKVAKAPVNIKNIRIAGNTILGNYVKTYEVVHSVGALSNPRQFIENTPVLPTNVFQGAATSSTSVRTFLDFRGASRAVNLAGTNYLPNTEKLAFVADYNVGYLTGTTNKSIIKNKFSNPGGVEVMTPGYTNFRSDEYSVYNAINYRNLSIIRPYQGPSGTLVKAEGAANSAVGIRVSDIHSEDYGLRSHLARHTARFGRDSLHVRTTPGATYDELPGMHKVHRNNIESKSIQYTLTTKTVANTGLTNSKSLDIETNANGVIAIVKSAAKRAARVFDGEYAAANNNEVKFSFSSWLKPDSSTKQILQFGFAGSSVKPIHDVRKESNGAIRYTFYTSNASNQSFSTGYYQTTGTPLTGSAWKNMVVTVSGTHGNLSNNAGREVKFFVNGVEYASSYSNQSVENFFPTSSQNVSNFRGYGNALAKPVAFFGRVDSNSGYEYTGEADELAIYADLLTSANVSKLYNSGSPQNLTQSGMPASASLLSWWRMGDDPGDTMSGYDSAAVDPTGNPSGNVIIDVVDGANIHFTAQSGNDLKALTGSANLAGAAPDTYQAEEISSYPNKSLFDNFFVKHQIPRSSKQYAWITASVVATHGHVGFTPPDFKITSSLGYIDAYLFVSASEVGSFRSGASRRYGLLTGTGFLPQVSDLNLNIFEPLTSSTNTLGFPSAQEIKSYVNTDGLVPAVSVVNSVTAFNSLMFKRGNQYGFPSWKQTRQAEHPIVRAAKRKNKLQITKAGINTTYVLPPVSLSTRLHEVGIQTIDGSRIKLTTTHQPTFFNSTDLNNEVLPQHAGQRLTPLQAVILSSYATPEIKNIDYIAYAERVFPSARNEFVSHSTGRLNYSNGFYHSNRYQRNIIGALKYPDDYSSLASFLAKNPRVTGSYLRISALGYEISASAWPLDAQTDFLTRVGPVATNKALAAVTSKFGTGVHRNYDWLGTGSAGELQNTFQSYFIESDHYPAKATGVGTYFSSDRRRAMNALAAPLYARKHMLSSPLSVVNPNSIINPLATRNGENDSILVAQGISKAGGPSAVPWQIASASHTFGGEALWEAGNFATVYDSVRQRSATHLSGRASTAVILKKTPAVPAYNSYEKFVESIKFQSRGKAIIPEYRSSTHIATFLAYGNALIPDKKDYYDIPGTTIDSSDSNFYVDYSNSEFLKYFAQVKMDSGLEPAEIQLVCSASIKFHPYEGFFPAQRTMDMVKEFRNSYQNTVRSKIKKDEGTGADTYAGLNVFQNSPGSFRPVMQAFFAPGILYNTIKSGIAIDYPILYNRYKMMAGSHYTNTSYTASTGDYTDTTTNCGPYTPPMSDYAINTRTLTFLTSSASENLNSVPPPVSALDRGYGSFWDERVPFEAILDPNLMANTQFADCEPHPSASINTEASFEASTDNTYNKIAKNFFGAVAEFYLKDSEFTSLKSETVYKDDFRFESGSVYMARVKMRRSVTGSRDYSFESGSFMPESYSQGGGTALLPRLATGNNDTAVISYDINQYFELPQDPMFAPSFYETFTMYSRPSGFGPPVAGHAGNLTSSHGYVGSGIIGQALGGFTPAAAYTGSAHRSGSGNTYQIMDSFKGYNWSFTPPYYHGESWADLIFRPKEDIAYDLERILAETKVNYWRVDPGPKLKTYGISYDSTLGGAMTGTSGSIQRGSHGKFFGYHSNQESTSLIHDPQENTQFGFVNTAPYAGSSINGNAMQLSASLNLFGVERVFKETTTAGPADQMPPETTNETVGKRWIISTKFETPMLNFNDRFQPAPVSEFTRTSYPDYAPVPFAILSKTSYTTDNTPTKTLPTFASSSAPNGMWHQFGSLPHNEDTGVFIEINDMPKNWLRNHYNVRLSGSIYNNNSPDYLGTLAKEGVVKSLRELCGFKKTQTRSRVGELKDALTVSEAIVAVPYIIESAAENLKDNETFSNIEGKFMFRLPNSGESVSQVAADAINKQVELMNKYIVPPQFDFINYPDSVVPVSMYIFEFTHTFDRDDLSFMWQNLMPRDHEKGQFKSSKTSHALTVGSPLEAADIIDNPNLRWMVFKIKQKSQANYYDYVNQQAGALKTGDDDSPMQFNWPYDYFSIIEFVNIDTNVLFNNEVATPGKSTTIKYGGSITSQNILPPMSAAPAGQTGGIATMPTMQVGGIPTPQAVTYSQAGPMQAPTIVGASQVFPSDLQAVALGTPERSYVSAATTGRQAGAATAGRVARAPESSQVTRGTRGSGRGGSY